MAAESKEEVRVGVEIERKFLIEDVGFLDGIETLATPMRQGYLTPSGPGPAVRVRLAGPTAFLTIKGPSSDDGLTRAEYEYEVPVDDAHGMIGLCVGGLIEKTRYEVEVDGVEWVIDVFEGENAGLTLAEVELESADVEVALPEWLGEEVTGDPRYYNSALARAPYSTW